MKVKLAAFICFMLLVCLPFDADGICEAAPESLPLDTLPTFRASSIAAYGDRLLLLNQDGLYEARENGLVRLEGNYAPCGMEPLPELWREKLWAPENDDLAQPGTSIMDLVYSRQGDLYSFNMYGGRVNSVAIEDGQAIVRHVCDLDLMEKGYVSDPSDTPICWDVMIDGSVMYLVLGEDPAQLGHPSPIGAFLLECDLRTGSVREVLRAELSSIEYEAPGRLLAIQTDYVSLKAYLVLVDTEAGRIEQLARLPGENQCSLMRDLRTGTLYYTAAGEAYQGTAEGGFAKAFDIETNFIGADGGVACISQRYGYLVSLFDGIAGRDLARQVFRLHVAGNKDLFADQYTDLTGVRLSFTGDSFYSPQAFAQDMINHSPDVDIYRLSVSTDYFIQRDKGFFAPLGEQETLAGRGLLLYPQYQEIVMKDGALAALPLNAAAFCLGYNEDLLPFPVPDSWPALLKSLCDWLESNPDSGVPLFSAEVSPGTVRWRLANQLLEQYWLACEAQGLEEAREALTDALQLLDRLESALTEDVFAEEEYALALEYNLAPGYHAFLRNTDVRSFKPLSLSFVPGADALYPLTMNVYLVNPYGAHQREAAEYLAYAAGQQSAMVKAALYQDGAAAESRRYVVKTANLLIERESLTAALEKAEPDEKKDIEARLDQIEVEIASLEENRWEVEEESLARYRSLLPWIRPTRYELPQEVYADSLARYLAGETGAGSFCDSLFKLQSQWMLENGLSFSKQE